MGTPRAQRTIYRMVVSAVANKVVCATEVEDKIPRTRRNRGRSILQAATRMPELCAPMFNDLAQPHAPCV